MENNQKFFFKLRRNFTGEKEFSISLTKLDGTPAKFFSNEISVSFIIRSEKNSRKRKMYDILPIEDTFLVLGIQDLKQLSTLNPIFLDISNSPTFDNFVIKYSPKKHFYRFRLLTVMLSSKMLNVDNGDIIVSCIGLNDCKKSDVNRKPTDVLGIIHIENIANWNQLKSTSSWVNIDLTDYSEIQRAGNISFSFITDSIHDIAEFDLVFLSGRGEHIKFLQGEQKIPQKIFAKMEKTEDTISELMLGSSSIHGVGKIQVKTLLKKTMGDIRKFQKGHEEDRKQIKLLTAEKQKLNQKLQILLEENKALKDLAKMPLDDEMARNDAWRELAREKNVRDNRREYVEAKRNYKTKKYREETESEESEEEEREYKRPKSKKKKKSRQEESESKGESESESEEEVIKKKKSKKKS